jgi:hypothetical protein
MAQSIHPGRFGHSGKPDDAWLAKQGKEPILEPELPIIDTHHHLWDRGGWTYLLPELLTDLNTGHDIVATVFEECRSMYRASGPVEMRPVGEVEFVAGIAAMSASGSYGAIKVAQSIVGYADPLLFRSEASVGAMETAALPPDPADLVALRAGPAVWG